MRKSLDNYWTSRYRTGQSNYLERIHKEAEVIKSTEKEMRVLEDREAELLNSLKNTQRRQ